MVNLTTEKMLLVQYLQDHCSRMRIMKLQWLSNSDGDPVPSSWPSPPHLEGIKYNFDGATKGNPC